MAAINRGRYNHVAVEEALAVLAVRDLVYFDHSATQWVCGIPVKSPIRMLFGEVKCMLMRSADGVLICAHVSGAIAYVTSSSVGIDEAGNYVDISFLPTPTPCEHDEETDGDGVGALVKARSPSFFSTKNQPEKVDLRGCFLDHSDLARVSRSLAGNCFVTVLSLSGNHIQDGSISLLADALLQNGCLQELNLSYNEISALGSTLLATAVTDHTHLKILDLMHNRIGRDGILPWLGRTLRSNNVLQELRLTHNDIGDRHGCELVSALAPPQVTAEEQIKSAIARRRTVATAAPHAAVAAAMPKSIAASSYGNAARLLPTDISDGMQPFNTTLTMLLLGNTGISDEAASHLGHVLKENRTLTHLDISSNVFSDTGNQSIAMGIAGNHTLRHLNYSENRIDEPTGIALVGALRQHPKLDTALFQDCLQGSGVASAIAGVLRANKALKTIDLSHCALEPPGVVDFYRAIGENSTLHNLEMTCMSIKSDQAVAILSKSVEANTALRFLNLSYNEITLRGCKLLRDAAAQHGSRLLMSLEGNSGERKTPGVQITGGPRPARPPILNSG